jgi:hypothetical protein
MGVVLERLGAVVSVVGACSGRFGRPEHDVGASVPRPVPLSTPSRLLIDKLPSAATVCHRGGGRPRVGVGVGCRAVCGDRCSPGAAAGMRPGSGRASWSSGGVRIVRDDDPGPVGALGLAFGARRDACRDGGHRRLLEARLLRARGRLRHVVGQRSARQERPRSQDGHQRRGVAVPAAGARAVAQELRAATGDP